jgi:hypothetical protein
MREAGREVSGTLLWAGNSLSGDPAIPTLSLSLSQREKAFFSPLPLGEGGQRPGEGDP